MKSGNRINEGAGAVALPPLLVVFGLGLRSTNGIHVVMPSSLLRAYKVSKLGREVRPLFQKPSCDLFRNVVRQFDFDSELKVGGQFLVGEARVVGIVGRRFVT